MLRVPKSVAVTTIVAVVANAVGIQSASAFMGIADTGDGLLAQILVNTAEALKEARAQTAELRDVVSFGQKAFKVGKDAYDLAKNTTQLAMATYNVGAAARNFSGSRFGTEFKDDMLGAFPELAWVANATNHPLGLGEDNPYNYEVVNALKYCGADYVRSDYKDACTRLKGKQEKDRVDAMMAVTFGILPASKRPAPKTAVEALEQTCEDRFRDAWSAAEAKRKLNLVNTVKMTELQQKCIGSTQTFNTVTKLTRVYGVGQTVVNDARKLDKDVGLGLFGPESTVDAKQSEQAKKDEAACRELEHQQNLAANAMRPLNEAADAAIREYDLCTSRLAELRRKAGQSYQAEKDVALATAPAQTAPRMNATKVKIIAPDGYNILDDPSGQRPHAMAEGEQ
jgi:hypothetical protein